jgi:ABC-type uncharacterized transport system permease subunit
MVKITKKAALPRKQEILIQVLAIVLALVFAGIVIAIIGFNPFLVYLNILDGSVGSGIKIQQTIIKAIPLLIASMGILVAFKMKFWNIGGEGQIMMGAFGATLVALNMPETVPSFFALLLMMVAGIFFGAVWAFIPAAFKAKFGTNETIFTLMLNYIAIKFVTYLQTGPWRAEDSQGFPKIETFTENEVLPRIFGVHAGWILAILSIVLVYVFMNHTKKGYEIAVVGESLETARYAGMNIKAVIVTSMIISGGLCGLAGAIQASAVAKSLTYGISAGIGFTAIITAWLGKLSAPMVAVVCIFFAMLLQGGNAIQVAMQLPASVADMIQGVILFFVLGSEFFLRYNVSFKKSDNSKEVA